MKQDRIALFDLDGTLADYDGQLFKDLRQMASEYEPPLNLADIYSDMPYIKARRHVITSQVGWWLKLKKFQLGWDVLEVAMEIGYSISVLTKGPYAKHAAWGEKVEWCHRHLAEIMDGVTITHDKGLVYGVILVDDWPDYINRWLEHRPRGLVIMPAHDHNTGFDHPNVVRYNGTNLEEVKTRMQTRYKESGLIYERPKYEIPEPIISRAICLFGNRDNAIAWLTSSIPALGGQVPAELLGTPEGVELVLNTIGRIEHGVYS